MKAFLIHFDDCFGCHACEVACQMLNNLPPDQFGIKVCEVGPWPYGDGKWQYDYVPVFTNQCTCCATRVESGRLPSCVQHCGGSCLEFGEYDELFEKAKGMSRCLLQPMGE